LEASVSRSILDWYYGVKNFLTKYDIVVIEKAGAWGCLGGVNLPIS